MTGARRRAATAGATAALALWGATAAAQAPAASELPGRRFELPPPEIGAPDAAPATTEAPAAPVAAPTGAPVGPTFVMQAARFVFDGPPLLDETTLQEAVAPLIGRRVSYGDLEATRRLLTEFLIAQGFVNSGVLLPDQRIVDGVVVFRVLAGRLTTLRLGDAAFAEGEPGLGVLDPDYVRDSMALDPEAPFNLAALQERLRLLLRDRNIDRIDASVRPGDALGEAVLDMVVTPRRPVDLAFSIDNASRAELGELTGAFSGEARNLIGYGDALRADARLSQGVREIVASGDFPLVAGGPSIFFSAEYAQAQIVEQPLRPLDIKSRFARVGVGLSTPLIRSSRRDLDIAASLDFKATESFLLGERFSFSDGVRDGETQLSVLSLTQTYLERGETATFAARTALRFGLPLFGADVGGEGPDARFVALVAQAQGAARLSARVDVLARAQAQLASDALLPAEKVALGGAATVRGYREGVLIGDQAFAATLEARVRLLDAAVQSLTPPGHDAALMLSPFVDYGMTWDKGRRDDATTALSVGAGLSWSPTPAVRASLSYGVALRDVPEPADDGGLQAQGVHFALSIQLP